MVSPKVLRNKTPKLDNCCSALIYQKKLRNVARSFTIKIHPKNLQNALKICLFPLWY